MRRTLLRVEKEDGEPLEIEVNGKRLIGRWERGTFYAAVVLLALGTLWITVAVVLPVLGVVLGVLFSIVGVGIAVVIVVVILVALWWMVVSLLDRSSERSRSKDDWDE